MAASSIGQRNTLIFWAKMECGHEAATSHLLFDELRISGAWNDTSIYDSPTRRIHEASGLDRRYDARGNGRTRGATGYCGSEAAAAGANQRGDSTARGR
jgi:hypothetical protein